MSTINGRISFVKKNDYGFYSFAIGKDWYSAGKEFPFEKGDVVEFDSYLKDGKWKTVKGDVKKLPDTAAPPATTKAATNSSGREDYWANRAEDDKAKEPLIIYFAALERAIQFAALAIGQGAISLEKVKVADKLGILQAFVDEQTLKYANSAMGAQAVRQEPKKANTAAQEAQGPASVVSGALSGPETDDKWN